MEQKTKCSQIGLNLSHLRPQIKTSPWALGSKSLRLFKLFIWMSRLKRLILDQVCLPGCPGGAKYAFLQGVRHLLYLLGLKGVLLCHAAVCGCGLCLGCVFSMQAKGESKGEKNAMAPPLQGASF